MRSFMRSFSSIYTCFQEFAIYTCFRYPTFSYWQRPRTLLDQGNSITKQVRTPHPLRSVWGICKFIHAFIHMCFRAAIAHIAWSPLIGTGDYIWTTALPYIWTSALPYICIYRCFRHFPPIHALGMYICIFTLIQSCIHMNKYLYRYKYTFVHTCRSIHA